MKSKLIFLLSLMVSLFSFGQETYKSVLKEGATKWLYFFPQDACMIGEVIAYGDTIINQMTYKKLWEGSMGSYSIQPSEFINENWNDYTFFKRKLNGYIRQSDDASKLYLFAETENVEYLMLDMNLKVGDEFSAPEEFPRSRRVKNIFYKNGLKIIDLDGMLFIEGVGATINLFQSVGIPEAMGSYLICFRNNTLFYNESAQLNDTYTICACLWNNLNEINADKYDIKKSSESIEISFGESGFRTWEMFDIYGRKIQKSEIVNQQIIQIPISDLISGIYFLRIYNSWTNERTSVKIII